MHLSDSQVGLLLGFAAVVFYTFVGVPLSRYIDRHSRRLIMVAGLVFWSFMTVGCGLAQNFWQLFAYRVGLGAGESFNSPAIFSMMADMFPPEKLPRAIAFLNIGYIAGSGIALIAGGGILQFLEGVGNVRLPIVGIVHGWQLVFFIVGTPGIFVGLLCLLTVPEPVRRGLKGAKPPAVPLTAVLKMTKDNWRAYGPMFLGLAANSMNWQGTQTWLPVFFQRTFGWDASKIGYLTGVSNLAMSLLGLVIGAVLAERFAKAGRTDGNMRVVALAYFFGLPFAILGPLVPNPWVALVFFGIGNGVAFASAAPFNAALQVITPNHMRGQLTALYLFIFTVIGSGLGPSVISSFTDFVLHNDQLVKYSLAASALLFQPLSAYLVWKGLRAYGEAYHRVVGNQ
jgi:MFS family permease